MGSLMKTLQIIVLQYFLSFKSASSKNKIRNGEFLEQLFDGYSKYMLPILDIEKPVDVNLSLYYISLNDVDTKQKTVSATLILELQWIDQYLIWNNSGEYDVPSRISIDSKSIWLPDLFVGNNEGLLTFLTPDDIKNVILLRDGHISAYPYKTFELGVDINIYKYPFDTQVIELEIMPWSYYSHELAIRDITEVNESNAVFKQFRGNGEWDLATWSRENFYLSNEIDSYTTVSTVIYKFTLKRRWLYTILNLVAPVVITSLLNPLSFLLPVDSGERISLSNTVFLTLAVFFTIVSNSLPQTSEGSPIFVTYIGLQMFGSVLTIAFTIISLACYYSDNDLRQNNALLRVLCSMCGKNKTEKCADSNSENLEEYDSEHTHSREIGKICSKIIDRVCFWMSLLWNLCLLSITIIIAMS
ncbi:neuronal acetylcholine receptor subunit alpha-7-like [Ruditapes philippinarum]|uniref:neuronal acetylcholine receptor subunit alpha-7-like n=1 Tax=Ruditapes philippinarum TaxID=129788 RepID=UPI00295A5F1E|nr:neuronal acetylcholine receptor subunit alpha-7-like [Ruditapes philippinarum]